MTLSSTDRVDVGAVWRGAGWIRLQEQLLAASNRERPDTIAVAAAAGIEEYGDAAGAAAAYNAFVEPGVLAETLGAIRLLRHRLVLRFEGPVRRAGGEADAELSACMQ